MDETKLLENQQVMRVQSDPSSSTVSSLSDGDTAAATTTTTTTHHHHVILFYQYAPLSDDETILILYKNALQELCTRLELTGRILLGLSTNAEGLNGTLSSCHRTNLLLFTFALLGSDWCSQNRHHIQKDIDTDYGEGLDWRASQSLLETFWCQSQEFALLAQIPVLTMASPDDFKWSSYDDVSSAHSPTSLSRGDQLRDTTSLFPDLHIRMVKEIIRTGGKLSNITIPLTSVGYVTPQEWHEIMKEIHLPSSSSSHSSVENTIIIDCRNHKEYAIGHFTAAVDPNTKTFDQFPRWVQQHKNDLQHKDILMYCTGGIRCEKASAYIRQETNAKSVRHLKGGIHKYVEQYGTQGYFGGKNFVFDRRIAVDPPAVGNTKETCHLTKQLGQDRSSSPPLMERLDTMMGSTDTDTSRTTPALLPMQTPTIVGQCVYCRQPHDRFHPDHICTVCRELVLICADCKISLPSRREYHCHDHQYLKLCYFSNLTCFHPIDLQRQLFDLERLLHDIRVGKQYKQKRRTLLKQCERIRRQLREIDTNPATIPLLASDADQRSNLHIVATCCRSCGDSSCPGDCWGFHGLERKKKIERALPSC